MPQAVKSNLLLYAHDSCFMYQKVLNQDFENICDWFVDKKLSIHFGYDKTKSILSTSKRRAKNIHKLIIIYKEINIKQQAQITYLGCVLDKAMPGEPMVLKVINKINGKLKFLYWQNKFLTPELRRILCDALIQPHFDYTCPAWYKLCTVDVYGFVLDKMQHISLTEFKLLQ